ncbi:unnamed protein product [Oncorhynchus mykiss]|uniref:Uncharacterized protein n=1 Tax=Oncorhynchus mykiss TaxID=8022 RepID=A0A060XXR0_ONCMY|nr:unnamed protein product [Oncorhynchus mykiss]
MGSKTRLKHFIYIVWPSLFLSLHSGGKGGKKKKSKGGSKTSKSNGSCWVNMPLPPPPMHPLPGTEVDHYPLENHGGGYDSDSWAPPLPVQTYLHQGLDNDLEEERVPTPPLRGVASSPAAATYSQPSSSSLSSTHHEEMQSMLQAHLDELTRAYQYEVAKQTWHMKGSPHPPKAPVPPMGYVSSTLGSDLGTNLQCEEEEEDEGYGVSVALTTLLDSAWTTWRAQVKGTPSGVGQVAQAPQRAVLWAHRASVTRRPRTLDANPGQKLLGRCPDGETPPQMQPLLPQSRSTVWGPGCMVHGRPEARTPLRSVWSPRWSGSTWPPGAAHPPTWAPWAGPATGLGLALTTHTTATMATRLPTAPSRTTENDSLCDESDPPVLPVYKCNEISSLQMLQDGGWRNVRKWKECDGNAEL